MRADRKLYIGMIIGLGIVLVTGVGGPFSDSLVSAAAAADQPTTVLVLQHAERFDFTKTDNDPELTPEGKQRAQELVHAVGNAGIAAIFSPKAKRMEQTVQPLQQFLKLSELNYYEQGSRDKMLQSIKDQVPKERRFLSLEPGLTWVVVEFTKQSRT